MRLTLTEFSKKNDERVLIAKILFDYLQRKFPVVKIEDVATTTSGGTPNRGNTKYYDGKIPWLKSGELNDWLIEKSEEFISEEGLKNSSAKLFSTGTLLVAMYGATAGKTGILNIDAATNQAVCAIFPSKKIRRDFLYWFFRQHRNEYINISKGGAQPNISQTVINETDIPLPDLQAQDLINHFLETLETNKKVIDFFPKEIFNRIDKFRAVKKSGEELELEIINQQSLLKQLRQSILQDAVKGKLVPQKAGDEPATELLKRIKAEKEKLIKQGKIKKEKPLPPITESEIPYELPKGWAWCRFQDCGLFLRGKSKHRPRNDKKLFTDGKYPFIQTGDVSQSKKNDYLIETFHSHYNEFGLAQSRMWKKGTLCITIAANIAETGYLGFDACVPDSIVTFTSIIENDLAEYVRIMLDVSREDIKTYAPKTAQMNINLGIINELLCPLPPQAELKRILQKVKQSFEALKELEKEIAHSKQEADYLLNAILRETFQQKKPRDYPLTETPISIAAEE